MSDCLSYFMQRITFSIAMHKIIYEYLFQWAKFWLHTNNRYINYINFREYRRGNKKDYPIQYVM
jgi:hypothetical protein